MLPSHHKNNLEALLGPAINKQGTISALKSSGGGCINEAFSFKFGEANFFLKANSKREFPGMFDKERKGLIELAKCTALLVPKPVLVTEIEDKQYLVMEYFERAPETKAFYERLGKGLAALHQIRSDKFGFGESNYIGSMAQHNNWTGNWQEFFVTYRLEPLVKWCYDEKFIPATVLRSFENLYHSVNNIFPEEKASLLHGDLWSGNKMNTLEGPAVFDPAVYYGHREMDIAMTKLFGGFSPVFYESYIADFPLEKGYAQRMDICNLYPLLVHVKLFGGSYLEDVLRIIKRF